MADHHHHHHDGRPAKMFALLTIDVVFFFLEIIVGYSVHSLALVADSFHMLNDIISLLVAMWALKLSKQRSTKHYTYGWQRAEILGGLVNGVFLMALCVSIVLEAIQRFIEPPQITNPMLVFGVGCAGLTSNIIGLFLFHDHGHSHGHSHSHGPSDEETAHRSHSHEEDADDIVSLLPEVVIRNAARTPEPIASGSHGHRHRSSTSRKHHFASPEEDIHVHPAMNRQELMNAAALSECSESAVSDQEDVENENTPLIANGHKTHRRVRSDSTAVHRGHHHTKARSDKRRKDTNMHSVFLHVLGDALGNVGVIATALLIKFNPGRYWIRYADPSISLLISFIIMYTAVPLVKNACTILLQGVPQGISLEDVKSDIQSIKGVQGIHELHIWQLSDVKLIASVHIQITFDRGIAGGEAKYMKVAKSVRTCFHEFGIHSVTIQVEYRPDGDEGYGAISGEEGGKRCLLECAPQCEAGGACCEEGEPGPDHS